MRNNSSDGDDDDDAFDAAEEEDDDAIDDELEEDKILCKFRTSRYVMDRDDAEVVVVDVVRELVVPLDSVGDTDDCAVPTVVAVVGERGREVWSECDDDTVDRNNRAVATVLEELLWYR